MKICFVSSSVPDYKSTDSTPLMVFEAVRLGHEVFLSDSRSFTLKNDGFVYAEGINLSGAKYRSIEKFIAHIKASYAQERECISLSGMDSVFFRSISPSRGVSILSFIVNVGRILESQGVFVVNSPDGIMAANSKLYIMKLPEDVRPKMLVSRSKKEIKAFYKEFGKPIVIKPLSGYGGTDVFRVGKKSESNINSIIETVTKRDYAVVQEFVSVKKKGDKRALLLDGEIVEIGGRHAIYFRQAPEDDMRSNLHVGGERVKCRFTESDSRICRSISAQIKSDSLFFTGIDIIGDKLLEVNVMCPGGIYAMKELYGINVSERIIKALEKKVFEKKKSLA